MEYKQTRLPKKNPTVLHQFPLPVGKRGAYSTLCTQNFLSAGLATYTSFQMSHLQLNAIATEESGRFSWDGHEKECVKGSFALDDKVLSVLAFR